ncbi:MAG TPA: BACON domain-containing carbohydrate-binding protein [Bryobacteraceae bacterium]|nr:BACON domain-containing carbohydrate-binding protein [Bryobacteraceae bacterium]
MTLFAACTRKSVPSGLGITLLLAVSAASAATLQLANPSNDPSSRFGAEVRTLANGNFVVSDPVLTVNGVQAAGAVYLFNGSTGALISTLTGTAANEAVGGGGIGVLTNGNFVVFSNYGAVDATHPGYSSTFVNGTTGLNGVVSINNSLVQIPASGGSTAVPCLVGQPALPAGSCESILNNILTINPSSSPLSANGSPWDLGLPYLTNESFTFVGLPTGNYLILSPGTGAGGAVTFGNGTTGVKGVISASNSLVGIPGDLLGGGDRLYPARMGPSVYSTLLPYWAPIFQNATTGNLAQVLTPMAILSGVTIFPNGDYIVVSEISDTLTFGSGMTGVSGTDPGATSFPIASVTPLTNGNYVLAGSGGPVTLINGTTFSTISTLTTSSASVTALTNGNYVVTTPTFGGSLGAATLVNGATGLSAALSASNSLVGAAPGDMVGSGGVIALPNGNYVVLSPAFDGNIGAATFGNGTTGITGVVSASNSLVGAGAGDKIGSSFSGSAVLTNNDYVVSSPLFSGGKGAITWCNGNVGTVGTVTAANSLVGAAIGDSAGSGGIFPLSNGNFVVSSPAFGGGVGAATWGSGSVGIAGVISAANSLVGSTSMDQVGATAVALTNGNYVVVSPHWSNGATMNAGAVTFGNGTSGVKGTVSSANSLVGTHTNDNVGLGFNSLNASATFVPSQMCPSGSCGSVVPLANGNYVVTTSGFNGGIGAVTFGNGVTGTSGAVSASNSLLGSAAGDRVGAGGVLALPSGNYVAMSPLWSSGTGASTFGNGNTGTMGTVSSSNSLVGAAPGDFVGFDPWFFLSGFPGNPTATSAAVFQTFFSTGGGSGNSINDLTQFGIPSVSATAFFPAIFPVLSSGDYVVLSPFFSGEKGAATMVSGQNGLTGVISSSNSFLGSLPHAYFGSNFQEDQTNLDKVVVSGMVDLGFHSAEIMISVTAVTIQTNPAGLSFSVDNGPAQTATAVHLLPGTHNVTVTATQAGAAGTQYVFTGWSDNVQTASRSISVGSTSSTFTANFQTQYQLTTAVSPQGAGSIAPASGIFFPGGTAVPIVATANTGFFFNNWTGGGSIADANSASTTITLSAPTTVTANFNQGGAVTIQTVPPGLQVTVDSTLVTTPQSLSLTPGSHTVSLVTTQAGTTGTQYVFTGWSDSGAASHTINVGVGALTLTATFKTQYQLATAASPIAGGSVSPGTGNFYDASMMVNLSATANSGFQFVNWTGPVASSTNASTTITMSAPATVTANFVGLANVTIQTSPPGLQFSVDNQGAQTAPQTLSLTVGQHTITVVGNQPGATGTQYVFTGWSDGGAASHSITVSSATTLTASFKTQYQLTVTASPTNGGTVSPASGFVDAASVVNVTATANSGFQFTGWTGPVTSQNSASTTVTVNTPVTLTASFTALTTINVQTSPPGLQFTIDGGTAQNAPQTVSLTVGTHTLAVAASQATTGGVVYQFLGWADGPTSASRSITATSTPATFIANFLPQAPLTITTNPAGLQFTIDGGAPQTAPTVLSLPPGLHTMAVAGVQTPSTGTRDIFTSWSDGGAASHTITVGSLPAAYTANFETQYQLTTAGSPAAGGSVSPASGGFFDTGTVVNLTAIANNGFLFTSWSGPVAAANSATTTVTMNAPTTVTANFSASTGITIQTNPPGLLFTIDGGAAQTAPQVLNLSAGTHTMAVATTQQPASGTQELFTSWNDGGAASHSITVTSAPATYLASFKTQYQLTISASPAVGGTVTPASGFFDAAAVVNISVTPAAGFLFMGWTGSVANASNASTTVTMTGPKTVTANLVAPGFTLNPASANVGAIGGAFSVTVTSTLPTATWTAVSNTPSFLTITSGAQGTGNGTVSYNVAANTTSSQRSGTLTIAGQTFTVTQAGQQGIGGSGLSFFPVTPCRVMDTRAGQGKSGPYGPPTLASGGTRDIPIPSSGCNIPATAQAYSLNITVVPNAHLGYLSIWPSGQAQPVVSTLNSLDGAVVANAAIVPAGANGAVSIFVSDATDVIIDINGFFATAASQSAQALAFYPVTPCRVADTRGGFPAPFGAPSMTPGQTRDFPIPSSSCNVPASALTYSLNVTVVPKGPLTYLSTWPAGQTQPVVSTLNAFDGRVAANAAIVPAGSNGAISVFVSDATDVIIDVNGYFAPAGGPGALNLFPVTPCRVTDTRSGQGATGQLQGNATRNVTLPGTCGLPGNAAAYSLNMTVVPPGPLTYLSTWPLGQSQPVVSTLNSFQGKIVANAALVPAGQGGGISVFASNPTDLIIDVNAYFGLP